VAESKLPAPEEAEAEAGDEVKSGSPPECFTHPRLKCHPHEATAVTSADRRGLGVGWGWGPDSGELPMPFSGPRHHWLPPVDPLGVRVGRGRRSDVFPVALPSGSHPRRARELTARLTAVDSATASALGDATPPPMGMEGGPMLGAYPPSPPMGVEGCALGGTRLGALYVEKAGVHQLLGQIAPAKQALQLARGLGWPEKDLTTARTLVSLARLYDGDGDDDGTGQAQALRLHREALAVFQRCGLPARHRDVAACVERLERAAAGYGPFPAPGTLGDASRPARAARMSGGVQGQGPGSSGEAVLLPARSGNKKRRAAKGRGGARDGGARGKPGGLRAPVSGDDAAEPGGSVAWGEGSREEETGWEGLEVLEHDSSLEGVP
jgi:hypothetical protein